MAKSFLCAAHFQNEEAAFAYVEARLWPDGPTCPFCGECGRIGALKGKTTRPGLRKCYSCKKPFTVRMGTIFESSHLALHLWLQIIHLMCASKKGISTRQIQRMLLCSMKTAWFLTHRIREAMAEGDLSPFGSNGGAVESDEAFLSRRRRKGDKPLHKQHKMKVLTLIDRDAGRARSTVLRDLSHGSIWQVVSKNVSREARLMTDEASHYRFTGQQFASHETVNHGEEEYARGDVTTNTVEGYFSIFKKGMKGIYQHCEEKHLHRYLAEFDFRYSNREAVGRDDVSRADVALRGFKGKRLTYETTGGRTTTI